MKQPRENVTETIEALAARAKALCLQGPFWKAAKILSSDGVAPDNVQTFRELKTLHPLEEPRLQVQDYSSQGHQYESKIPNLTQHRWYFDNGIIARTEPEMNEAFDILTASGKTCGLELRRDKCEVWSKGALNTIDSRIKRNKSEGLEILGAAVGSPRFVASSKHKRVQKIEKLLKNLEYINDPHCALGILRSCLGPPKMVYSLRCNTPSEEAVNIFEEFDSLQRTTFENILGSVLCNESWHQACLPINKTNWNPAIV